MPRAATLSLVAAGVVSLVSALFVMQARQEELAARTQANVAAITARQAQRAVETSQAEAKFERDRAAEQAHRAFRYHYAAQLNLAQADWEDDDWTSLSTRLQNTAPDRMGGDDLRAFEWHYWTRRAQGDELRALRGHSARVSCLAFSADGRRIATGGEDGTIRIWQASSGEELVKIGAMENGRNINERRIYDVAFSADSQAVLGTAGALVKVWNADTGEELLALQGHTNAATCVRMDAGGQRIATGGMDGTLKLWDAGTGQQLFSLGEDEESAQFPNVVYDLAFSPDGSRIATANHRGVTLWDTASGREAVPLVNDSRAGITSECTSIAYSPDGRRIAAWTRNKIEVWDAATGAVAGERYELGPSDREIEANVSNLAFSSDGDGLAAVVLRRTQSEGGVSGIVGQGYQTAVVVWKTGGGGAPRTTIVGRVPITHWSAFGLVNSAVQAYWMSIMMEFSLHAEAVFSPDGRLIGLTDGTAVTIWDAFAGQDTETTSYKERVGGMGMAFSPDTRRLATPAGGSLKVLDRVSGSTVCDLEDSNDVWQTFGDMAFSPDGLRLASGGWPENSLRVWDAQTGKKLATLRGHADQVVAVVFSPDGQRIASGSVDHTLKVWDAPTGQERLALRGHDDVVGAVAFCPDDRRIASGSFDGQVKIWNLSTGEVVFALEGHTDRISALVFSPDGRRLASGSVDDTIVVWNTETGKRLATLLGHSGDVKRVAFSPDGGRLATASADRTVKLWDPELGQELLTLEANGRELNAIAFSADGRQILGGSTGALTVWDARPLGAEVSAEREANSLLRFLARRTIVEPDAREWIQNDPTIGEDARKLALELVDRFDWISQVKLDEMKLAQQRWEAQNLNDRAWQVAVRQDASRGEYQEALRQIEASIAALGEEPANLNTLGVVYYRLERYDDALGALSRAVELKVRAGRAMHPADAAFLAMAQHRLGHCDDARRFLIQFQELIQADRWKQSAELQAFLQEAEALIEEPLPVRMDIPANGE